MMGLKSSLKLKNSMREMAKMRDVGLSKLYLQKHNNILPFEDNSRLISRAQKHEAGFLVFASHNKKRPDNLIFHRFYENQVLDVLEMGVDEIQTMEDFKNCMSIEIGQQPILMFQGDCFDMSEKHEKFRNMMIDFFRIKTLSEVNIVECNRLIVFTSRNKDEPVLMQQFESGKINEALAGSSQIALREIGPRARLDIRRYTPPTKDLWKACMKKIKTKTMDEKRNIEKNELGQRIGKAFIQQQDLGTLALKKVRKRKMTEVKKDDENDLEKQIQKISAANNQQIHKDGNLSEMSE
jgi:ribosome production factor 2